MTPTTSRRYKPLRWGVELVTPLGDGEYQAHGVFATYRSKRWALRRARREAAADRRLNQLHQSEWVVRPVWPESPAEEPQ